MGPESQLIMVIPFISFIPIFSLKTIGQVRAGVFTRDISGYTQPATGLSVLKAGLCLFTLATLSRCLSCSLITDTRPN